MNGSRFSTQPRRILLILPEFPPSVGGMQTHALYLSRYLARSGWDVLVVTYRLPDDEQREVAQSFDAPLGFPVFRQLSRLAFWYNIWYLDQVVARYQPDLIYSSTVFYGFLGPMTHVPIVCRSVGNDVLRAWIAYPFRPGSRLLVLSGLDGWLYSTFRKRNYPEWVEQLFRAERQELVRRAACQMDLLLANSEFTANLLRELGVPQHRVQVLVGGVDAERFNSRSDGLCGRNDRKDLRAELRRKLGIPENAYVMTTICRLVAKKGIDFLLCGFRSVHHSMPDSHLLIVGDGPYRARYERLAAQLGISPHVTFAGLVAHQDVHRYYWASDLFVLASREQEDGAGRLRDAETMGRVLCEANASGVPLVATRSGGIPSVVVHEENGLLFEADNEEDLLRQICRVRQVPALNQAIVSGGLTAAWQRFDWSVVLRTHEEYFKEILEQR